MLLARKASQMQKRRYEMRRTDDRGNDYIFRIDACERVNC
jgi:hypothetical protein